MAETPSVLPNIEQPVTARQAATSSKHTSILLYKRRELVGNLPSIPLVNSRCRPSSDLKEVTICNSCGSPRLRAHTKAYARSATVAPMGDYKQVWNSFVSGDVLEFGGHMDPGWQAGHTLSASFIVPVDVSALKPRLKPLRDSSPDPCHSSHYIQTTSCTSRCYRSVSRYPNPEQENEISPERLAEVEAAARRALKDFPAFEIEFANLNAFPGAAFHRGVRCGNTRRVARPALWSVAE